MYGTCKAHRLIRRVAVVVVATVVGGAALAAGTRLLAGEASGSPLSAEGTPGSPQRPLQSRGAAVAPALATNPDEIQGHITLPVVGIVSATNPTTFAFKFSGLVNASPDQWSIAVDVLNPADADPGNETNWVYAVATFRATGGGPDLFTFSVPGVTPFASLPTAWKPGGLGRMRVRAVMDADSTQWALLTVQDVNGFIPANPTTIVVADNAPDPTLPPGQTLQSIKNPLNPATPNYLSANRQVLWYPPGHDAEQTAATNAYYSQIQTSARGTGTGQSIQEMLPTVQTFVNRYFGPFECSNPLNTPETVAKYFNKGDLGIGREMHCINRGCTGELACYVKNFGKADGTPVFNNASQAKKALLQNHPFATVAMVERQLMAANGANRVFFVAYNNAGSLLFKAQLDNKGYNTSMPGNCLQCHGINSTYTAHGPQQIKNAIFLPFDLNSFGYFSADSNNALSRARQEPAFRALNRMVVSFSSLFNSPEARALVEGWYGGDLFGGTFNGSFVPPGWQDTSASIPVADQAQLYRKLVAVACRTCHISYLPATFGGPRSLNFGNATDFIGLASLVRGDVCDVNRAKPLEDHHMPAAEQTLKTLWQSAGRSHLFAQVPGLFGDCGLSPPP